MFSRNSSRALAAALTALHVGAVVAGSHYPSDDAYVDFERPGKRLGASQVLRVGTTASREANAYLRFTFDTLPPGTTGADVEFAALRVFVAAVRRAGEFSVHAALDDWSEDTLNGAFAPGLATPLARVGIDLSQRKSYLAVDVTDQVRRWLDGEPNHGVGIRTPDADFDLDSKENRRTGHTAEIKVVLAGAVGPRGPQGPPGAAGTAGLRTEFDRIAIPGNNTFTGRYPCRFAGRAIAGGFTLLGHETPGFDPRPFVNRVRLISNGPAENGEDWIIVLLNSSAETVVGNVHRTCARR